MRGPAHRYERVAPPVRNVNEEHAGALSWSARVADRVAAAVGSWPFIIVQSVLLACWVALNVYAALHWQSKAWDPYPFILLNLMLSFQAAYTGPVVLMSQNRQAHKDRLMAQSDYECSLRVETEMAVVLAHLQHQDALTEELLKRVTEACRGGA